MTSPLDNHREVFVSARHRAFNYCHFVGVVPAPKTVGFAPQRDSPWGPTQRWPNVDTVVSTLARCLANQLRCLRVLRKAFPCHDVTMELPHECFWYLDTKPIFSLSFSIQSCFSQEATGTGFQTERLQAIRGHRRVVTTCITNANFISMAQWKTAVSTGDTAVLR